MSLVPGFHLGPYELVARLGAGGMGEVWRAKDSRLGRGVAIKVIAERLAGDEQTRARLQREARSVSALNHPNICSLFDIGSDGGWDYLVMEFVEGETLARTLLSGPMPIQTILTLGAQIVEAVQEAHILGITHRDLKPANIMVTPRGRVKVLDFGLATRAEAQHDASTAVHSNPGMMIGTLAYMSPEQASGATLDHRSDIFSIGVVLYEMTTGTKPFDGTPAQIGAKLLMGRAKPVQDERPDVPPRLARLIERCMARMPEDRFPTAAAVLAELKSANEPERRKRERLPAKARKKFDSIAVLPFTNTSEDEKLNYLSDGIAEGVLHQLSKSSKLRVLARSTTFRYRNNPDPVAVGRELRVPAVLTGEVSIRQGAVTISVELVDTKKGAHIWGRVYADATARTIDEQIAREAAEALDAGASFRTSRPPMDSEAHKLYLRGRYAMNKSTQQALNSAIQSFRESIDRDPTFALGFAGLADAYLMFDRYSESAIRGSLSKARAAAMRALQIDDSVAEAHTSLAMIEFNQWNWEAAEREFQRAIALNPNYDNAHYWYSIYLVTRGRISEAVEAVQRAHELDPLSAPIASHLATFKVMNGDVKEGVKDLERLAETDPKIPMLHQWLAFGYFVDGQCDRAVATQQHCAEMTNHGNLAIANLAFYSARAGQEERARELLAELRSREDVPPMCLAGAYAALRDYDNALTWLEKCVYGSHRSANATYATWPPWFDEVQDHPRYVAVLHHMGL